MVDAVRLYIEGGGNDNSTRSRIRQGFGEFLDPLRNMARTRRLGWHLVACGGRDQAFKDFHNAIEQYQSSLVILLVDSEELLTAPLWKHLEARDKWNVSGYDDDSCHLMVPCVEAWLVSDAACLERYYGQHFNSNQLPKNQNIETVEKIVIQETLDTATRRTQKGTYRKIEHCAALLGQLDRDKVQTRAPHCKRLFDKIGAWIDAH